MADPSALWPIWLTREKHCQGTTQSGHWSLFRRWSGVDFRNLFFDLDQIRNSSARAIVNGLRSRTMTGFQP